MTKVRTITSVLVLMTGAMNAQSFTLDATPLHASGVFTVSVSQGPPHQPWHLAFDESPGPVHLPMGTVELGFTHSLFLVLWNHTDAQGNGSWSSITGNATQADMIFSQAAIADPASPTGSTISNPFSAGIHPVEHGRGPRTQFALGDDDAVTVDMPTGVAFPFFGTTYTQVSVSSNGLLTFGGTSIDPTEQVSDFLAGLPKIAALWDDLDPTVAGEIFAVTGTDWIRVEWQDLPQFFIVDHNSAEATLFADGRIMVHWPEVELQDGLVGIGPGSWLGQPTYANFAEENDGHTIGMGPVLEQFHPGPNPFDLEGRTLSFFPMPGGGHHWFR